MVKIDPPHLPPRLYRYRDLKSPEMLKQELDAIKSKSLWFSRYKNLNDQMEGVYRPSPWLERQDWSETVYHSIFYDKSKLGICCFSDAYDNELMWAHYAGTYGGICVAYSTNDLCNGLGDDVHIVRVAYGSEMPRIGKAEKDDIPRAARTILSHKKSTWHYECEWRMLKHEIKGESGALIQLGGEGAVKKVFIGFRMDMAVQMEVKRDLANLNIEVQTMAVDGYEHKWV